MHSFFSTLSFGGKGTANTRITPNADSDFHGEYHCLKQFSCSFTNRVRKIWLLILHDIDRRNENNLKMILVSMCLLFTENFCNISQVLNPLLCLIVYFFWLNDSVIFWLNDSVILWLVPCQFMCLVIKSIMVLVIIFWYFLIFYKIILSLQVKQGVIISNENGIYQLPYEFPNDLKLKMSGN